MRLLVDQSFPSMVEQVRSRELELVRFTGPAASDLELLQELRSYECRGVVFLGVRSLMANDSLAFAKSEGLAVIGTYSEDPFEATMALANNISAVERMAAPASPIIVYAKEIKLLTEVVSP